MPISYAFYKRHGQGTFVCTCARAHRASVSQERLDRLCSNLVSELWAMNYVLSTSHGWYISARAHVHTALLHLGNGLADCVQIWCLGWGQGMEWTGSICWIHNPVQSRRIWIGLDQKFTNSADSGLDWIQKCAMYIPYLDSRQFLLIVTLTSEVLPSNLQLFTSSFVFTCRFYKAFGRYLPCCVRIGLDWIQILVHQLDWTGLGSVARGFGLDWIVSTRSIPYSGWGLSTRCFPQVMGGVHLHVRTCAPLFHASGTAGCIVLKFGG